MAPPVIPSQALLLCGYGHDLGDFKVLAASLARNELSKRFKKEDIIIKDAVLREEAFQAILSRPDASIKEIHIFSHSIGGGLYVGYHEPRTGPYRVAMLTAATAAGRNITYREVLTAEIGGILTDHLVTPPFNNDQAKMRAKFAKDATGKFWGCNAGVPNWVYSDDPGVYYWSALNTQNVPKPSIAQAFADFWGIPLAGASSGAHMEVLLQKKWITTDQYKREKKHWPGTGQVLRLNPDKGSYKTYTPTK